MASRALPYILALLLTAGCQGEADDASSATAITNGYLANTLPQVPLNVLRIETVDLGDRWQVTYRWPEGGTGGPMVFVVDKRDGRIVDMD